MLILEDRWRWEYKYLHRLFEELTRLAQIPLVIADCRQVIQGVNDVGVAVAVELLEEFEGLLEELACLGQVSLGLADLRQVVQRLSDKGMVRAERLFAHRQ